MPLADRLLLRRPPYLVPIFKSSRLVGAPARSGSALHQGMPDASFTVLWLCGFARKIA